MQLTGETHLSSHAVNKSWNFDDQIFCPIMLSEYWQSKKKLFHRKFSFTFLLILTKSSLTQIQILSLKLTLTQTLTQTLILHLKK